MVTGYGGGDGGYGEDVGICGGVVGGDGMGGGCRYIGFYGGLIEEGGGGKGDGEAWSMIDEVMEIVVFVRVWNAERVGERVDGRVMIAERLKASNWEMMIEMARMDIAIGEYSSRL